MIAALFLACLGFTGIAAVAFALIVRPARAGDKP